MNGLEKSRINTIIGLHNQIIGHFRKSVELGIKIGELLVGQKERLKHGEFTTWINKNLPFTDRTARRYIMLYQNRDRFHSGIMSEGKLTQCYRLLSENIQITCERTNRLIASPAWIDEYEQETNTEQNLLNQSPKFINMNVSYLSYNQYNTNKMSEETYERIKEDVRNRGFLDPVIYHCSDGEIISGNHRVKIARELRKESELKLKDIGNPSLNERVMLAEMFNSRGFPDELKKAEIYYLMIKKYVTEGLPIEKAKERLAMESTYSQGMIGRYYFMGERITKDHPWFPKEIDGIAVSYLHAYYLLRMDKTRKTYQREMGVEEQEHVMRKIIGWLRNEYRVNGRAVSADRLQAKIRSTLVTDFGKHLPDLTDVPWASVWYPEKRVESIRHFIEEEAELGTYRRDWKFSMNRLTRVSAFPMSIAFNLLRLLSRELTDDGEVREQAFRKWVIVDPFCGYGIRVVAARYMGHTAYGYDVSPKIMTKVKELWSEFADSFFVGDSRYLPHEDESVDLIFTSPPYWRVEKYEESEDNVPPEFKKDKIKVQSQLSRINDYHTFLSELFQVIAEMKRVVKVGGYLVLVVANFREKGKYYPFVHAVEQCIIDNKFEYFDKLIIAHDISKPTGGIKSIEKNHTRVAHEEMLIFKKGNKLVA